MYFRLSLDPRIFLPLVMLGGLATSLVLSARPKDLYGHGSTRDVVLTQGDKPAETLPAVLDPGSPLSPSALRPEPASSSLDSWLQPSLALPGGRSRAVPPRPSEPPDGLRGTASSDPGEDATSCPDGMVLVEGDYCPNLGHVCLKRLDGPIERCAEYAAPPICDGPAQKKRFCIDRFEYPNLEGVRPVVMVSWIEARAACEAESKRLCTGSEWTLACEGAERVPYPYGYSRDSTACNIDRPHPDVDGEALLDPRAVAGEVARLDQRVPSGQMARCKSPYGVQDMTGNVDEWVTNEKHFAPPSSSDGSERPFISALKGGYWGPVRNRCRATTTAHDEWFRYYEVGFRCCADAP